MEMNGLTKRLFADGYTKEHYPDYVRGYQEFDGGFTYRPEHLARLVFETPCGLLAKGSHFTSGTMSYRGVHWTPENNNPTVTCPRFTSEPCTLNHELLRERTGHQGELLYCACRLTDRPYSYEHSLDKAHDDVWKEADTLFEQFKAAHHGRACKHQSHYNRMEKKWQMFYDPIVCARNGFCTYCDVLQTELSPQKGNVFYDQRITWTEKGFGLFPDQQRTTIIKGKKLLDRTVSMTLCEAIVQCAKHQIQAKLEQNSRRTRLNDASYQVEAINIRALRRDTRDLLQDLRDAAEGIEIVHAGDAQKAAAQKKRERKQRRQDGRIKRLEKLIVANGLDGLEEVDRRRALKLLPQERIDELDDQHSRIGAAPIMQLQFYSMEGSEADV